jgi:hypothetical protein
VPRGQRDGSLWPYSRFSRQEPLVNDINFRGSLEGATVCAQGLLVCYTVTFSYINVTLKTCFDFRSRNPRIWPEGSITLTTWYPLPQKLALTSPTSGDRSVGIVRSRTQATEFVYYWVYLYTTCYALLFYFLFLELG